MLAMAGAQGVRGRVTGIEPREVGRDQIRKDPDCPFQCGPDRVVMGNY